MPIKKEKGKKMDKYTSEVKTEYTPEEVEETLARLQARAKEALEKAQTALNAFNEIRNSLDKDEDTTPFDLQLFSDEGLTNLFETEGATSEDISNFLEFYKGDTILNEPLESGQTKEAFKSFLEKQQEAKIIKAHTKPDYFLSDNTKACETLFNEKRQKKLIDEADIKVSSKKAPSDKQVTVPLTAYQLSEESQDKLPVNLTPFDREVYNGIITLVENGQTTMTLSQINEAFTGRPSNSTQRLKTIMDSVERIATTWVKFDCKKHLNQKNISENETSRISAVGGVLIPIQFIEIESRLTGVACKEKNQAVTTTVIKVCGNINLYGYASAVNQVMKVPLTLLNVPNLNQYDKTVILTNTLVRRIETAKNEKNKLQNKNRIRYKYLEEKSQLDFTKNRTNRKRNIDKVKKILNYWIEIGHVTDYNEYKLNNKIEGIELSF